MGKGGKAEASSSLQLFDLSANFSPTECVLKMLGPQILQTITQNLKRLKPHSCIDCLPVKLVQLSSF